MRVIQLGTEGPKALVDFLEQRRQGSADVTDTVQEILTQVRKNGDAALMAYTQKFDGFAVSAPVQLKVTREEIDAAYQTISPALTEVIRKASANIASFHEKQKAESFLYEKEPGIRLGTLRKPLNTVGIYVPAGTAPLPSSVLMNAMPAKVAGVKRIVMVTPPGKEGKIAPAILVAADIAGVTEIYKVGGAQAVAALAYGTQTIPQADKITGPGNIFVATAKKLVYGTCDIDMVAGPSEILIVADKSAKPAFLAADMLSQAEHDKLASSILITTEASLIPQVEAELQQQLNALPRKEIAESSLANYGAIVVAETVEQAIEAANIVAPEHLELCLENAEQYLNQIENAGAIFLGNYSPEPLGDYYAGPNHVLPTTGSARFFSPLNVWDFIKQTSVIAYEKEAFLKQADDVIAFAQAESLDAHARSIAVRKKENT